MFCILFLAFIFFTTLVQAQIPGMDSLPNTQTVGGMYFWQDVQFTGEWRIQRSVVSGTHRLLDPQAVCRARGSRDFCERILAQAMIPPVTGRVLILLHGFASGSISLENMALWFRKQGDYTVVLNVSYPSLCCTIEEEAEQISQIVDSLENAERIDFVGHSLGSLILRYYLGNYPKRGKTAKIGRFVQVCPPNQGSSIAQRHNAGPVGAVLPILGELALNGPQLREKYGIPQCEFAILAGYGGDGDFWGEENDAVLPVSATRLDGAKAWKMIRGEHSEIPNKVEAFQNIREFLNKGEFLQENGGSPP